MGQNQSKEELLYNQVSYGNVDGIRSLHREGAGLEWLDKEGKTPLIVACMKPDYIHVAKTLIELGANINAYRPGSHAGTPLHHAAKRGLEQTVRLLLSHGGPVVVRPYWYPYLQKDEIGKQCAQMLQQGIIRLSGSPFSSQVFLSKATTLYHWLPKGLCKSSLKQW